MTEAVDRHAQLSQLSSLIERHARSAGAGRADIQFARATKPTSPRASIAEAALAFVAQGSKRVVLGDHVYDYGAGDFLVVSVDLPVSGHFTRASAQRPFLGVGIPLRPPVVAALLLEHRDRVGIATYDATSPALAVSAADQGLLGAVIRLVESLDAPEDLPVLYPLIEREIVWRLLRGPQGALVAQIAHAGGHLARVGQTIRWIRDHHDQPFRVEELAAMAHMSVPTFHRQFRAATTMGPIQYQKKVRLQQARLLLASTSRDVTRVAHQVGYGSASQFSREYRREFGNSPVHDLGTSSA